MAVSAARRVSVMSSTIYLTLQLFRQPLDAFAGVRILFAAACPRGTASGGALPPDPMPASANRIRTPAALDTPAWRVLSAELGKYLATGTLSPLVEDPVAPGTPSRWLSARRRRRCLTAG